jgi:phage replication O-like protein O
MVESNDTRFPNLVDKKPGYTKIADKLLEAYCRFRIPGEVRQVIDTIMRKTDGWNKQEDQISLDQFVTMTGLKKPHVIRAKKMAITHKLITQKGKGPLSLNKEPGQWIPFTRTAVARNGNLEANVTKKGNLTMLPKRVISVARKGKKPLPEMVPTKDRYNDTTKDSIPAGAGPKLSRKPLIDQMIAELTGRIIARMQMAMGYPETLKEDPIPNPAKEATFIKKMLTKGFTEDQIIDLWLDKCKKSGEFVSMYHVNRIIGIHGRPRTPLSLGRW